MYKSNRASYKVILTNNNFYINVILINKINYKMMHSNVDMH